jgi:hypothetical protein
MNKYQQRMARRSYYSKPVQVILGLVWLLSVILMVTGALAHGAAAALGIGIVLFVVLAIVTWRGRRWNRIHVLRSESELRAQSIMTSAVRNAMPQQPVQQPQGQPTTDSRLSELDRLRNSGKVSDEEYAAARARIIDSL